MQNQPIGIFDSGVGGLSVFREIHRCLPDESIVYFADSANCPYGSKDRDTALKLSGNRIEFLLEQGCKLIVVACNTVTAVAIDEFRKRYSVPFIGMEPALKPAVAQTTTGKIGVLATENTFNGRLFRQTREKYANGVQVIIQPGYGLVELVENGEQDSEKAMDLLKEYLVPMIRQGADTLVLGCTHYPFLINTITQIVQDQMQIIDPSQAVAAQTRRVLEENKMLSDSGHPRLSFYTTGTKNTLENILSAILDLQYDLKGISP
jgi:glutamate racemase